VHDVGVYFDAEDQGHALQEGYVLTIEPGLYIPADDERVPEEYRGIGVRIEDDVVITADGARNLTSGVPKELDEIEAIRAEYL
jgi:Xaa-Pro aminopeptidase